MAPGEPPDERRGVVVHLQLSTAASGTRTASPVSGRENGPSAMRSKNRVTGSEMSHTASKRPSGPLITSGYLARLPCRS